MPPTTISDKHCRRAIVWRRAVVMLAAAGAATAWGAADSGAEETEKPAKRLADATRVPVRGEAVPPAPAEPVSLTTELVPEPEKSALIQEVGDPSLSGPESIVDTKKRWTLSLETRGIYDDNIYLSGDAAKKGDFVFLFTPSITWRHGDTAARRDSYATASYSPSASIFVDESGENSVDHTLRADVQKRFSRLAVGVEGRYQRLSGATVELSDRVDRDEYGAKIRARYDLSSRTELESSFGYNRVKYREAALENYDEWVVETFAGYALTGRTRVAAGGAFGRMDVDGREAQDFKRALVKVTTDASGKMTLDAKGGVEVRDTGAGRETTPVFNVTAEYRPTARTAVSAGVYREVTASASVDSENLTRTGASLRLQQKLGSRFTAGIETGYETMDYSPSEAGVPPSGREDDYFFVRPSLRYEFHEGRRAEIYYSLREDDSTIDSFDFEANQAGFALGFDF